MTIAQIETNVKQVLIEVTKETFVFDLLLAYGLSHRWKSSSKQL